MSIIAGVYEALIKSAVHKFANEISYQKNANKNNMKVIIQSPDFKTTRKLEKFLDEHVRKLHVFYNRIMEGRVLLKMDNSDKVETKVCELQIVIPGNDLFASKRAATFEEAATRAVDAVKNQLDKLKR